MTDSTAAVAHRLSNAPGVAPRRDRGGVLRYVRMNEDLAGLIDAAAQQGGVSVGAFMREAAVRSALEVLDDAA